MAVDLQFDLVDVRRGGRPRVVRRGARAGPQLVGLGARAFDEVLVVRPGRLFPEVHGLLRRRPQRPRIGSGSLNGLRMRGSSGTPRGRRRRHPRGWRVPSHRQARRGQREHAGAADAQAQHVPSRQSNLVESLHRFFPSRWAQSDRAAIRAAPRTHGGRWRDGDGVVAGAWGCRPVGDSCDSGLGSEGASPAERPSGAAETRDAMSRKARRAALGSRSTAPTARPVSTRPRRVTPALTTSNPASKPGARRLSS